MVGKKRLAHHTMTKTRKLSSELKGNVLKICDIIMTDLLALTNLIGCRTRESSKQLKE